MPTEPEREIEKRLRAYAKKRREQAGEPLNLHPATRRLLQSEVTRQFGRDERAAPSFWQGLKQLWPRYALGLVIFALLAAAATVFLPPQNKGEMSLTKNEPNRDSRAVEELRPSPSAAPAPDSAETHSRADRSTLNGEDRAQREKQGVGGGKAGERFESDALGNRDDLAGKQTTFSDGVVTRSASAPASATALADTAKSATTESMLKRGIEKSAEGGFAYKSLDTVTKATPAPATPSPQSVGGSLGVNAPKNKVSNSSAAQPALKAERRFGTDKLIYESSAAKPVLASFQLERNGQQVRIVDADGSVYSGLVEAPALTPAPLLSAGDKKIPADLEAKPERKAFTEKAKDLAQQTYLFHVAGTNRTSNEKVVFSGTVVASTNETSFQQQTYGLAGGGTAESPPLAPEPAPLSLLRMKSRVSGRAVIGEQKEIEINAVPVKP